MGARVNLNNNEISLIFEVLQFYWKELEVDQGSVRAKEISGLLNKVIKNTISREVKEWEQPDTAKKLKKLMGSDLNLILTKEY